MLNTEVEALRAGAAALRSNADHIEGRALKPKVHLDWAAACRAYAATLDAMADQREAAPREGTHNP